MRRHASASASAAVEEVREAPGAAGAEAVVLRLQSAAGNVAVTRPLARDVAEGTRRRRWRFPGQNYNAESKTWSPKGGAWSWCGIFRDLGGQTVTGRAKSGRSR